MMRRRQETPRSNWQEIVEGQGLTYAVDPAESGRNEPYWNESACFVLSEDEVEYLEGVTQELHERAVEACRAMVNMPEVMQSLGLPRIATDLFRESLDDPNAFSLYGRFDFAWGGDGDAKLLEYNADCPAALVEAAVTQWYWLEDRYPERDQWNMLHERLVQAWQQHAPAVRNATVHFAVGENEPNEDWATVAYLRDTAREAGLTDFGITMEEIGWHSGRKMFVDGDNREITTCFKMYPWDWMLAEDFSNYILGEESATMWIEPAWKTLAGSKALLAVMWQLFPDHPNLVPAYLDGPRDMTKYVMKPTFGWEGAGIRIVAGDVNEHTAARHTEGQSDVYQQYIELPKFEGGHVVLGSWVVNGHAAGLGIRESDNRITDTNARFVPHLIDAPRSSPEQVQQWLKE
jgi:glutathionylspermidine synthase